MDEVILKIISMLGVPGLVTWCAYKLLDKHMTKFLEVADRQAVAIEKCAASMADQRNDQAQILTALRVVTRQVEEQTGWTKQIDERLSGAGVGGGKAMVTTA